MSGRRIRIAVIGYGYWGPNIARNLGALPEFELTAVCDASETRRALAALNHPRATVVSTLDEVFAIDGLEAVAIATPVATHYPIAIRAIEEDLHVFVEKPLAESSRLASDLIDSARDRGRRLMVGHTFVYTGAVRKIRDLVACGELGDLLYFDSCRVNLGLLQHDVDVTWDLAVHDIAIIDFVSGLFPSAVSAVGVAHAPSKQRSAAFLTLTYSEHFVAHIDVNWMSPVKVRRTLVGGTSKMAVWDDVEPSEKVRVYDTGVDAVITDDEERREQLVQYRTGDVWVPKLDSTEALAWEFRDFAAWIRDGDAPPNTGEAGLRVVRVLEAASRSMDAGGAPVEVGL